MVVWTNCSVHETNNYVDPLDEIFLIPYRVKQAYFLYEDCIQHNKYKGSTIVFFTQRLNRNVVNHCHTTEKIVLELRANKLE